MSSRAPRSQSPARSGRKPRHGNTAVDKKRFSDDPRAGRPRRPRSDAAGYPRAHSEERPPRAEQRSDESPPSRPSRPRPERSERPERGKRIEGGERFERRNDAGGRRRPERSNSRQERRNSRAPEVLPERFRGTVVEATAHVDQSFVSLGVG